VSKAFTLQVVLLTQTNDFHNEQTVPCDSSRPYTSTSNGGTGVLISMAISD
jgi:hypothetical protein